MEMEYKHGMEYKAWGWNIEYGGNIQHKEGCKA